MKLRNYILLICLFGGGLLSGCSKNTDTLTSSPKSTQQIQNKNYLSTSTTRQMESIEENYQFILEKDIFTPSELRRGREPGIQEDMEIQYEPQKLTITGIVHDGEKYLVSVENRETGESEYLVENEKIAGSPIETILDEEVKVRKRDFLLTYKVGDEIPLEGTRSRSTRVSSLSSEISSTAMVIPEEETRESLPPAANSIEEMLRQRRLQEEEELK